MSTPDFDALDLQARKRLNRRLDEDSRVSMAYRPALRDIIATFRVPRQYKTEVSSRKEAVGASKSALVSIAVVAVVLLVVFFVVPAVQLLCVAGLMAAAFAAGKMLGKVREIQTASIVPDPQQQQIAAAEDEFYKSLSPLIALTRSDVFHREALRWLQAAYSDSDSVQFRESVEKLLKGFGCRLAAYSEANADAFDVSTSNIPEIRTTRHAVFGADDTIIETGHVVFPQNQRP